MVPELRTYLCLSKPTTKPEFDALTEQWLNSQPYKRPIYKVLGGYKSTVSYEYCQDSSSPQSRVV